MLWDTYIIIGGYIVLTICCIIKKVRNGKSADFNFLWLILYNEFLIALSVFALGTPVSEQVHGTTSGHLPGEFIILTTVPLVLIGFIMKLMFLLRKKEDQTNPVEYKGIKYIWDWCKTSGGTFLYIFISLFPAWFTFCMVGSHLIKLPMWLPLCLVSAILLPVLIPLLPRLYRLFKPILFK